MWDEREGARERERERERERKRERERGREPARRKRIEESDEKKANGVIRLREWKGRGRKGRKGRWEEKGKWK